jgi:hypothetical protein
MYHTSSTRPGLSEEWMAWSLILLILFKLIQLDHFREVSPIQCHKHECPLQRILIRHYQLAVGEVADGLQYRRRLQLVHSTSWSDSFAQSVQQRSCDTTTWTREAGVTFRVERIATARVVWTHARVIDAVLEAARKPGYAVTGSRFARRS